MTVSVARMVRSGTAGWPAFLEYCDEPYWFWYHLGEADEQHLHGVGVHFDAVDLGGVGLHLPASERTGRDPVLKVGRLRPAILSSARPQHPATNWQDGFF